MADHLQSACVSHQARGVKTTKVKASPQSPSRTATFSSEGGSDGITRPLSARARLGKSAIDAVRQARQRCWRYDWGLNIDVKGYFDSIDWELLLRAVRRHTNMNSAKLAFKLGNEVGVMVVVGDRSKADLIINRG